MKRLIILISILTFVVAAGSAAEASASVGPAPGWYHGAHRSMDVGTVLPAPTSVSTESDLANRISKVARRGTRRLQGVNGYRVAGGWASLYGLFSPTLAIGAAYATSWNSTNRTDDAQFFYWRPSVCVSISGGPYRCAPALPGEWANTGWVSENIHTMVSDWLLADGRPFPAQSGWNMAVDFNATAIWVVNEFVIYDRNTGSRMDDYDMKRVW
jgi:hypothetical protein